MPTTIRACFVLTALLVGACAGGSTADAVDGDVAGGDATGNARRDAATDTGAKHDAHADARHDAHATNDGAQGEDAAEDDASASDACAPGATQVCTSSCGTSGTATCAGGGFGACAPPAETCNLLDDDCDGSCDDLLGCRIGVDRSYDATTGFHFYTTSDAESGCCGYTLEAHDDFYLYSAAQTGLVPFYRCVNAKGAHLYTTNAACEGETVEGSMGWIATSAVCGSVPLYRLDNATTGDHLYTLSSAEASSAEAGGYVLDASASYYVWPGDCGGPSCTWPSPIALVGSVTTAATGFPSTWYGFPIDGTQSYSALSGTVTVTNSADIYSEVLFILQYLPSGACTDGMLPASTPEYGPAGAVGLGNIIVKAPTTGTFTVPVSWTLPGGLPMSSCVLLGLNGGTVAASHAVTAAANLSLSFTPPRPPRSASWAAGASSASGRASGARRRRPTTRSRSRP